MREMSSEVGLCKYHGTKPDFLTAMGQEVMGSFFLSKKKQNQNKTEKGKEAITEAKKPTEELVVPILFSC